MSKKKKAAAVKQPVINESYELVATDRLTPHPRNVNRGDLVAIGGSISENGFYGAIVAQKSTGHILAGNHRYDAAKAAGIAAVPVTWVDVDDDRALRILLADNRTTRLGHDDQEALATLLQEILADTETLAGTGFDEAALDELLAEVGVTECEGLTDEDAVPEPLAFPVTEPDDLWVLGKHRLLCADSTSIDAVEKLLANEKPVMLFTDIPYNVAFNGRSGDFEVIKNDDLSAADFADFLNGFANTLTVLDIPETYQCCDWRLYPRLFDLFGCRALIVWAKNVFGMGRGYRHQHELIVYNGAFDSTTETDLWQIAKESSKYMHPTQKPVELPVRAVQNSSKAGQAVLDLFGGSGSTLIACEKTARKARLMELDGKYCDVIVKRWQDFTGKEAVLESDGRTFNEISAERHPQAVAVA